MSPAKILGGLVVLLALVGAARLDANGINGPLYSTVATPTGDTLEVTDTAFDLSGMLFGTTLTSGGFSNLITINPNDGSLLTSVGIMTRAGGIEISDLTVDSLNNSLYGSGDSGLYKINKVTGMATLQAAANGAVPDTGSFFMFPGALALLLVIRGLSRKVAA